MKKKFLTSIMATAFILAGCGTPQTGNGYIVPQQINEPTIAEITPVYETQVERVNNCDGTNPTYNVSYKTIEAQKASFEVSVGAGGLVTGTPIPSVLEVQLEAKITAALAKDYGLTTEKNHDLTLDNVQGTFLEHTITWKVTRVKGLVEVIYGDGVAQVGFEKIANVELYNRTSQSLGCNGNGASILPTIIVATLETQLTVLPSPLPTNPTVPPATSASINCPSSHLGAGKQFDVTLQGGCYYHFNIACNGCVAGQENNYLIYYSGNSIQVTVPEGSAWQYGSEPTSNQFSSDCATSSIDFWPAQLPSFLNISGVQQIWPCGVK